VAKQSAGLLLYRRSGGGVEVFLVHPGGPYWARKDAGAWSIPKGELGEAEDPLGAALREFTEETGFSVEGPYRRLRPVRQPGGKTVIAFAVEGDCDPAALRSGTFTMEWPPRSGRHREFPEVDRAAWFGLDEAQVRILRGQAPLLEQLRDEVELHREG
jgi:predicted NUDIX family NTP pyrophosphohydrolase